MKKLELESRLQAAEWFMRCKVMVIEPMDVVRLRESRHFAPVACYGSAEVPLPNEVGRYKSTRLVSRPLEKFKLEDIE